MRKTISYVSASLLCLTSCTATAPALPLPQKITIQETPKPLSAFTYLHDNLWSDPYQFVGSINYSENNKLIGTGVLIEPTLVLTAAHVPEGKEDLVWIESDGTQICISEVIYYPKHITNNFQKHDIAIMVLEYASDEIPVQLITPCKDFIYKRMPLTTVGHGHGSKRYSNPGTFWYYGRLISTPQFMVMLPLKASIWFGDSGGAVLTKNNKLIGIMAHFSVSDGLIFENGCASVEYYKDWIEEIKNEQVLERMDR
tara:strand:- start:317 stop:1081 length:765 start_codon:yes stop_codon:yes gene_type:complete